MYFQLNEIKRCQERIEHLKHGCKSKTSEDYQASMDMWKKTRIDRMLVEHFLRSGFYDVALKLAETSSIVPLTNIDVFMVAKSVEEGLNNRDTTKCLEWCSENKSKLKKVKSNLEFELRLQGSIDR